MKEKELSKEKMKQIEEELIEMNAYSIDIDQKEQIESMDVIIKKQLTQRELNYVESFGNSFSYSNKPEKNEHKKGLRVIRPPHDPLSLSCLVDKNTRLKRSIKIKARSTLGNGAKIIRNPLYDKLTSKAQIAREAKQAQHEERELNYLIAAPNPKQPFSEIGFCYKYDEESHGNGYINFSRSNKGDIKLINHLVGHTMRVCENGLFVQARGGKIRYYKEFGDNQDYDNTTGKEVRNKKSLGADRIATEVLQTKIYSPTSSYYGVPSWISATAAICGNKLSEERNIAFFENDAVGRLAIVVTGGKLTAGSIKGIQGFLKRNNKGTNNSNRIMVLQGDGKRTYGTKGSDVKIEVVPLTIGVNTDAEHQVYRKNNNEEVRESMGIGLPFFSAEDVNKASAKYLIKVTMENEFLPDINAHEYQWNSAVANKRNLKRSWRVSPYKIKFIRPRLVDETENAEIIATYTKHNILTLNEARAEIGRPLLPKDMLIGDMPLDFAISFFEDRLSKEKAKSVDNFSLKEMEKIIEKKTNKKTKIIELSEEDDDLNMQEIQKSIEELSQELVNN